jgi:transcriptional regulator with XRE-family HTH domain
MDEAATYRAFGRAVATRRRAIRKTQETIANQIGISRASLANIERGKQRVFLHQVLALANALGLQSAHEIIPARAIAPVQNAKKAKVTGSERLTPQQRREIEALVHSLSLEDILGLADG